MSLEQSSQYRYTENAELAASFERCQQWPEAAIYWKKALCNASNSINQQWATNRIDFCRRQAYTRPMPKNLIPLL